MNVRNCKNCGRIFNYVGGSVLCQLCREKLEEKFHEVKEYIRANPGVGISEVSEACDVEPGQIRQWLREDRLELSEDSPIFMNCESCGAPIRSGKYCEKCKLEMSNGFRQVLKSNRPVQQPSPARKPDSSNAKMRFL